MTHAHSLRRYIDAVTMLTETAGEGGTLQMWHGSRRWDGSPEIRTPRSGRYEGGPGIYFTNNYETAYKYAKGGGATMLAEIDRNLRLADDVIIPLDVALDFVKTTPRMRHKKEIVADLQNNVARRNSQGIIASVLINLTVNYESGSGEAGLALARFLRDQGVDASLDHRGGGEDWLVVINPKIIRSIKRIPAKDVLNNRHLPAVKRS